MRFSIEGKQYVWQLILQTNHIFCYLIFVRSIEFLNEITIVKTVEKTWSTVLRVEKLVPIPKKQEVPNLDITYLVRYVFETFP